MPEQIVMVCTANICRSPMAQGLLADRLGARGVSYVVVSAGTRAVGGPADKTARRVLAARGLDISAYVSTALSEPMVTAAALVLVMERAQVPEVVALAPSAFPKVYGLTEIVSLGSRYGGRRPDESLSEWVFRIHGGRSPSDVLRAGNEFDVSDPYGSSRATYERCADQLTELVDQLVALIC